MNKFNITCDITIKRQPRSPDGECITERQSMKTELIYSLTTSFEGHAQQTDGGIEFWLARDIQHLLGYAKWDNFLNVVSKAKTACEVSGHTVADHFADVGKMVDLGSGSQREVDDLMLTRYAHR